MWDYVFTIYNTYLFIFYWEEHFLETHSMMVKNFSKFEEKYSNTNFTSNIIQDELVNLLAARAIGPK